MDGEDKDKVDLELKEAGEGKVDPEVKGDKVKYQSSLKRTLGGQGGQGQGGFGG